MNVLHWSEGVLPVLDFESTGVDTQNDRIVTAALIFTTPKGRALPSSYTAIVNPGVPIPKEASDIHGITDERAQADGVSPGQALAQIVTRLRGAAYLGMPLVIYNAPFDWSLLHAECARHSVLGIPPMNLIDPLVLSRHHGKYAKGGHKLEKACERYGVTLSDAHTAEADAAACAELLRAMMRKHNLREMSLADWQDHQRAMHQIWAVGMNEYFAKLEKTDRIELTPWPGVAQTALSEAA